MTSIDDLIIEEVVVKKTTKEIIDDIKEMFCNVLSVAKKYLVGPTLLYALISLSRDSVPDSIIIDDSLPSIEITVPVTATEGTIKIVEECDARIRLLDELKHLHLLNDGWDNESAKRPTRLALRNASLLLTELDDSFLPGCTFFPSNDAGIYFQGRLPKGRFTVFLNDDKMAYVVKGESGKLTASVNINRETVKYLNIGLKEYV